MTDKHLENIRRFSNIIYQRLLKMDDFHLLGGDVGYSWGNRRVTAHLHVKDDTFTVTLIDDPCEHEFSLVITYGYEEVCRKKIEYEEYADYSIAYEINYLVNKYCVFGDKNE